MGILSLTDANQRVRIPAFSKVFVLGTLSQHE